MIIPGTWNEEIRTRIRVSVAAYAYEIENDPIMSDAQFDDLAKRVRPNVATGNPLLDIFFATQFDASTGMWVRNHPNQKRLKELCTLICRKTKTDG